MGKREKEEGEGEKKIHVLSVDLLNRNTRTFFISVIDVRMGSANNSLAFSEDETTPSNCSSLYDDDVHSDHGWISRFINRRRMSNMFVRKIFPDLNFLSL